MRLFCRVHFCSRFDRAQAIRASAELARVLSSAGVIPEVFYDTGLSKKEALGSPVSLGNQQEFESWLMEKFSDPEEMAKMVWAENASGAFQFGLTENPRKFRGGYFCHLKAPPEKSKAIENALVSFVKVSGHEVIVAMYDSHPPLEFRAMIGSDGCVATGKAFEAEYKSEVFLT